MRNPPPPSGEAFLRRLWADVDGEGLRPLGAYLEEFELDPEWIAVEYLAAKRAQRRMAPGLDTTDPSSPASSRSEYIGNYRIIRELGRGGQANVYLAEDEKLRRKVALKVLRHAGTGAEGVVLRFQREAEVTSRLEHPNICPVYEVGLIGTPFIAMRYVEGITLSRRIHDSLKTDESTRSLEVFDSAAGTSGDQLTHSEVSRQASSGSPRTHEDQHVVMLLVEKVARALHAAHELGVIHRDIKPGNIMIDHAGEPVILDFGLALQEENSLELTGSGALVGTPAYMSPEQLAGRAVALDRRTDIYSLGVTLYECLTLRRPFDAPTRESLYQAILVKEPPDPRRANPDLSRDIALVINTAIEKDRDRRYQTALEFADDLRRARCFEVISARPISRAMRVYRWSQRNPAVALSAALVFVVLGIALLVSLRMLRETSLERDAKEQAVLAERTERELKESALDRMRDQERQTREQLVRSEALRLTVESTLVREKDPGLGLLLALEAGRRQPSGAAATALIESIDRCREVRTFSFPEEGAESVAFSPDGLSLAVGGAAGAVIVLDLRTGARRTIQGHSRKVVRTEFNATGSRLLTWSLDGTLKVWDQNALTEVFTTSKAKGPGAGAFLDGGRRLLAPSDDGSVSVLEFSTGKWEGHHEIDGEELASVNADPLGRRIAAGTVNGAVHVFLESGERVYLYHHSGPVNRLRFSASGRRIISSDAAQVRLYDIESRQDVANYPLPRTSREHGWESGLSSDLTRLIVPGPAGFQVYDASTFDPVQEVETPGQAWGLASFSADGLRCYLAGEGQGGEPVIGIRRTIDWKPIAALKGHRRAVLQLVSSPDGRLLASVSEDRTVRLWDVDGVPESRFQLGEWGGHASAGSRVMDGSLVLTTSLRQADDAPSVEYSDDDDDVVILPFETSAGPTVVASGSAYVTHAEWSPDHKTVVASFRDGRTVVADVAGATPDRTLIGSDEKVTRVAFHPDGRKIATASVDGSVRIFDSGDGRLLKSLSAGGDPLEEVVYSDDGGFIAAFGVTGGAVWETVDYRPVLELPPGESDTCRGIFAPDGRYWIAGERNGRITAHDLDGDGTHGLEGHESAILDLHFLSGSGRLASAGADGAIRIWDLLEWKCIKVFDAHGGAVTSLATAGDDGDPAPGLVSTSEDGTARIWDPESGGVRGFFGGHPGPVHSAVFDEERRLLVTSCADGVLRWWDIRSCAVVRAIGPRFRGHLLSCGPDGTFLATPSYRLREAGWRLSSQRSESLSRLWKADVPHPSVVWDRKPDGSGGPFDVSALAGTLLIPGPDHAVLVRDARDLSLRAHLNGHRERLVSGRFDADGRRAATSARDGTVILWNVAEARSEHVLRTGSAWSTVQGFSADGTRLLTWTGDGQLQVWDTGTGRSVARISESLAFIGSLVTDDRGRTGVAPFGLDSVKVWDLDSGLAIGTHTVPAKRQENERVPAEPVVCAIAPDGARVAMGGSDGPITLVPVTGGRETASLGGIAARCRRLVFSPDGSLLASWHADGTVAIWLVEGTELYSRLKLPVRLARSEPGYQLTIQVPEVFRFTVDGSHVLVAGEPPCLIPVHPWPLTGAIIPRELSSEEMARYGIK